MIPIDLQTYYSVVYQLGLQINALKEKLNAEFEPFPSGTALE